MGLQAVGCCSFSAPASLPPVPMAPPQRGLFGHASFQLSSVRSRACSSLAISEDARLLLAATGRTITVWDYPTQANPSCQVCAVGSKRLWLSVDG